MDEKIFAIDGYVKNEGTGAYFKLQRGLPPGSKLSFSQAYVTAGKKSGLDGHQFLEWLRDNYLPTSEGWVFYTSEGQPYFAEKSVDSKKTPKRRNGQDLGSFGEASPVDAPGAGAGKVLRRVANNQKSKGTDITAETMVTLDYPEAGRLIDACKSKRELRKALALVQRIANRPDHMRHIQNRLQQV